MATISNLQTLKINYLTQTQYDTALANGEINSNEIYITPATPVVTADKYHITGSWSGLSYTASAINGADTLSFTVPTGTTSTTVALGNHAHGVITNSGYVGTASNKALYTGTSGVITSGTLPVAAGGTGVTTVTSGELMVGAGTSAITTKGIYTLTSVGSLGWDTTANRTKIPDIGALAYWNGRYNGSNSNLAYCSTGNIIGSNGGTISGTLILSKTQDASGTANNSPALIVGGAATASHLEFDGNEILAKSDGTTPGTLYLQDSTGTVNVNGSGGLKVANGPTVFQNNTSYTTKQGRNITLSTANPSGGGNGDVWIVYSA